MNRPDRVRCRWLASWVLSLALLALVVALALRSAEPAEIVRLARRARPEWLLLALGLQFGTYLASAEVFRTALLRCGHTFALRTLVGLGLLKQLTDAALPSAGIGGTLLIVRGLARRRVSRAHAIGAVMIDLVGFYVALALALAVTMAVLYVHASLHPATLAVVVVLAVAALSIPALALRLATPGAAPRRLLRARIARRVITELQAAPRALLEDRSAIALVSLLQTLVILLDAATLWVALAALGTRAPLPVVFAAYTFATVAGVASIVPAGVGVFEGGAVGTLIAFDVRLEAALAATLLTRALTLWLPMVPGLLVMRAEAGAQRAGGRAR